MKTYILYAWMADNEGGYAVCKSDEFTPERDYKPETGWMAKPSEKIAEFDTDSELISILEKEYKELGWDFSYHECVTDAHDLMREYNLRLLGWM